VNGFGLKDNASLGTFHIITDEISNSYYVDLEKIRAVNLDFLSLLSSNKRSQVRRSIKQYEINGELEIHESSSTEQALAMFEELVVLHQDEWNKRGKPGAFSNKFLYRFHLDLIRERFKDGEIQLLEIRNHTTTVGILYCFVYHGEVLFYQSGFNYSPGNVYRPGLVSHYYAIVHNAKKGMGTYDFLAGESAYKSSLSTDSVPMYWIRLLKNPRRLSLEKNILNLKEHIRSVPWINNGLKRIKGRILSFR
jgi:CelD/BcsL family acetyltransferase involved in cellulose biosynthesis